jgi:cobalt-zinc-cadmium efflux system outer membrane protein
MRFSRFSAACLAVVMAASVVISAQVPTPAPPTPAPGALTLDAVLIVAMAGNRTIAAARLQQPVDEAGIGVARQRPNPDLSFDTTRETPRDSVGLSFPIELGGKRDRRVDLANATVMTGQSQLARVIATVKNDVRRAYVDLVAAGQKVAFEAESRDLAKKIRDTADARFQAGEAPERDVVFADLELATAENEVIDAQGELAATRIELNALLGRAADAALTPADDLTSAPLPPLDMLLARGSTENAAVQVIDHQIAEQTARRNLARTLRTPDINLGGAVTFNAQPDFPVGWHGSFAFTVPLFTHHEGEVAVEDAELARLGGERVARVGEISGAVAAAFARASAARQQLARFDTGILPLAIRLEQMAEIAYAAGQSPLLELFDAQQKLRDVKMRNLDASLNYQHALADLERALGASLK